MLASTKFSVIVWRGLSTNGVDVCLVASIGGNGKTDLVLELSLFATELIELWPSLIEGKDPRTHGSIYVRALKEHGFALGVCPPDCAQLLSKKCYAQFSIHNAAQAARILRNIEDVPPIGLLLDVLSCAVSAAVIWHAVENVRSMVVGDSGMIPIAIWIALSSVILRKIPADEWLGYTHAWRTALHLKATHCASVDSLADGELAQSLGWNTFEGHTTVIERMPVGAVLCPGTKEFGRHRGAAMTCRGCPIKCNGQSTPRRRMAPRHGNGDCSTKAAAGRRGVVLTDSKGRVRGLYA